MSAQLQMVVNWPLMLRELRKSHGMRLRDIAREVGCISYESIRTYQYAIARPKHAEGERIIELWIRVTHRTRADLPLEPMPLSIARSSRL